jgi:hypothetical protein
VVGIVAAPYSFHFQAQEKRYITENPGSYLCGSCFAAYHFWPAALCSLRLRIGCRDPSERSEPVAVDVAQRPVAKRYTPSPLAYWAPSTPPLSCGRASPALPLGRASRCACEYR